MSEDRHSEEARTRRQLEQRVAELEGVAAECASLKAALRESEDRYHRYVDKVVHDLRNPLVTIAIFVGVLQRHLERAEYDRLAADLERIERSANEMQELLDDLAQRPRTARPAEPDE